MDQFTDLQAQVIALRTAVESLWLSMLYADPDRVGHAEQMHASSVAALNNLQPDGAAARAMRDQVIIHTDALWRSIEAQIAVAAPPAYRGDA